jgi:HPt (histidine-containing phosphotransfer) domain-containing protein
VAELPLLDERALERLRRLQAAGDPDLVAELSAMFLAEAPLRLDSIDLNEAATTRQVAHSLRGSAGQLGAARLAAACAALEERPGAEALAAVRRELEAVRPLLLALAEEG